MAYFDDMPDHCLEYAQEARKNGRPVVGILCEFTPRELILAADGVPVCLCGGSAEMAVRAEEQLPANLCPLIKSTFGYHLSKENPFLEMADLVVGETTCDGKKKMYELMGRSRPVYVLELPQKPDDADALAHWTAELRKFKGFLERRYKKTITLDRLREVVRQTNHYRRLRRRLADFLALPRPPITGRELLNMNSSIWCAPGDIAQYQKTIQLLSAAAPREDLAGRVRVMLTGVPILRGAEKVVDVIESRGGLVVCAENCTGLKPFMEDIDAERPDPLEAIAETYFHLPCSVMTPNDRRLESLRKLSDQFRPQCVIELVWQACLTYDVESWRVKQFVEGQLGLPYLKITTDYSPSDAGRIALRVEALFETMRPPGAGVYRGRDGGA